MENTNSYPVRFIEPILLKDGTLLQLRPIHPLDGNQAEAFRGKLSTKSIYDRFLGYVPKISKKLVESLTVIDYSKEMAIVVELNHKKVKEVIAIGRIAGDNQLGADIAIIIADEWQGKGLGSILTNYMIDVAEEMNFVKVYSTVFAHNIRMLDILRHRGFAIRSEEYNIRYAELNLLKEG